MWLTAGEWGGQKPNEPVERLGAEDIAAAVTTRERNVQLIYQHALGRFDGDLLFFTATLARPATAPTIDGWRDHATGQLINIDIP
jgi:hypothetical protein